MLAQWLGAALQHPLLFRCSYVRTPTVGWEPSSVCDCLRCPPWGLRPSSVLR